MAHFAVTAVGSDRPGIVAAISAGLLELDGNVEDSRMTILRGHFVVMLIVSLPAGRGRDELEARLGPVAADLALEALSISAVDEIDGSGPLPTHVITVYGADHPGIVSAVSAELAAAGHNITDLQTKLAGAGHSPLYVMMLEVALGEQSAAELTETMAAVAERTSVEISIGELDAEAL